jgi:hypothetical protein
MADYISKKESWIRLAASFFPAGGIAVLLCTVMAGPRLGRLYDFLLLLRPPPPVSGELLIVDTSSPGENILDNILEPQAAASALLTMLEFDAAALIIQVPVLGLSAGDSAGEAEIIYRFDEEFGLLSRNIRNLFDAIRIGSVAPSEAARYVGELVELSERGKERLVSALVHRDEEGIIQLEKAAGIFGNVRRPGDLLVQVIRAGGEDPAAGKAAGPPGALAPGNDYSRAPADRDGVLRRIAPVLSLPGTETDHIIYGALKGRYRSSSIEQGEWGPVLRIERPVTGSPADNESADRIIPLDKNGAILFALPHGGEGEGGGGGDFRRTEFNKFLEYDEADRSLRRLLGDAQSLGIYDDLEGEKNPVFLYDYALSLKDELLSSPPGADKSRWVEARNRYFDSLDEFLYGPSEMRLLRGYEDLIALEELSDAGIAKLITLRDSVILSFAAIREKYGETADRRNDLEAVLAGSFCIMGPLASRTGDTKASALLANSLLTGRVIRPGRDLYLLLGALASVLLTCFCIKRLGPVMTLGAGIFLSLLWGGGFSAAFIVSGYWLDPQIPAAAAAAGTLFSFAWALGTWRGFNRRFREAYGPFVPKPCLKRLIRAGKPLPSQTLNARTVAAAIRNPLLMTREDRENCFTGARAVLEFQNKAADIFKKAGAIVTGCEDDLVLASFGSPLDKTTTIALSAAKAADCIAGILKRPECSSWRFGLDAGECAFTWSALSGYSAFGRPMVRSRILSGLASRYKAKVVVTATVSEALPDILTRKLDMLKGKDGSGGAAFYELRLEPKEPADL